MHPNRFGQILPFGWFTLNHDYLQNPLICSGSLVLTNALGRGLFVGGAPRTPAAMPTRMMSIRIVSPVADHTRSDPETTLAVAGFFDTQRWLRSERPQVSHHPSSPGNKASQAEFRPVQMCFWVSDQAWNPNQDPKECEHQGHQA